MGFKTKKSGRKFKTIFSSQEMRNDLRDELTKRALSFATNKQIANRAGINPSPKPNTQFADGTAEKTTTIDADNL